MLESEIKKLTVALEANTAAILATQGGANALPSTPATPPAGQTAATPPPVTAQPAVAPTAGPGVVAPVQAPVAPVVTQPGVTPVVAPVVGQPLTHQQAQTELTAIVQQLGEGTRVQAVMLQYGNARLDQIPAENLFALVQSCKALLVS